MTVSQGVRHPWAAPGTRRRQGADRRRGGRPGGRGPWPRVLLRQVGILTARMYLLLSTNSQNLIITNSF